MRKQRVRSRKRGKSKNSTSWKLSDLHICLVLYIVYICVKEMKEKLTINIKEMPTNNDLRKLKDIIIKILPLGFSELTFCIHSCRGRANHRELRARRRWKYSAIASKHLAAWRVVKIWCSRWRVWCLRLSAC